MTYRLGGHMGVKVRRGMTREETEDGMASKARMYEEALREYAQLQNWDNDGNDEGNRRFVWLLDDDAGPDGYGGMRAAQVLKSESHHRAERRSTGTYGDIVEALDEARSELDCIHTVALSDVGTRCDQALMCVKDALDYLTAWDAPDALAGAEETIREQTLLIEMVSRHRDELRDVLAGAEDTIREQSLLIEMVTRHRDELRDALGIAHAAMARHAEWPKVCSMDFKAEVEIAAKALSLAQEESSASSTTALQDMDSDYIHNDAVNAAKAAKAAGYPGPCDLQSKAEAWPADIEACEDRLGREMTDEEKVEWLATFRENLPREKQ